MSVSQIKEGSRFINEKLKDKGYFSSADANQKLLFNTIDLKKLRDIDNDEEEPKITPTMLENDKHLINVIYELLDKSEKTKLVKEASILQHQQQANEISKLQKQNEFLSSRLRVQQEKLDEKDMEIATLTQSLKLAQNEKIRIKRERNQLMTINENLKEKQRIEIKRKNLEIDGLRDNLIIKLNSVSFNTTKSVSQASVLQQESQHSLGPPARITMTELIDSQTKQLLENSSNLIYDLIWSNELNSNFLIKLNAYFDNLNNKLSIDNANFLHKILPNFKQFLTEFSRIEKFEIDNDLSAAISKRTDFQELKAGFIANLSRFDQLISLRLEAAKSVNSDINSDDTALIQKLNEEIRELKRNWQKANENAENWKNLYKQSTAEV